MNPLKVVPFLYIFGMADCLTHSDWLLAALMWTAVVVTAALCWEK